jgi:hypothetical protein
MTSEPQQSTTVSPEFDTGSKPLSGLPKDHLEKEWERLQAENDKRIKEIGLYPIIVGPC